MKKLTSPEFWDREWMRQLHNTQSDQIINNQLIKIIRPVLQRDAKILEVGCVPAGRLRFLQTRFPVIAYGMDFSSIGLTQSQKENVTLVCADLFNNPFVSESFDFVFSQGVVEHFIPPYEAIMRHIDLTKRDGMIMITIPNFHPNSIMSLAYKLANRYTEVKDTHNMKIMELREFRKLFDSISGVEPILIDYFGPPVVFSPPTHFLRRVSHKVNRGIDRVSLHSKILSPEIVFVGRKT